MSHRVFEWPSLLAGFLLPCLMSNQALAENPLSRVVDRENRQKVTAVIEAVNSENRMVTVRSIGRDEVIVMEVGDEVRNLDQVEVGDRVVIEFLEALAVDLKKGGGIEPSAGIGTAAARAEPGEKPAGGVSNAVVLVATILGIDPDEPSVTLQGPEGDIVEILVREPEKLKLVDVGDQVVITYTRALAIAVEPSPVAPIR